MVRIPRTSHEARRRGGPDRPESHRRCARQAIRLTAVLALPALLLASCAGAPASVQQPAAPPTEPIVDAGWRMREADTTLVVELPEPFVKLVDLSRLRVGMTEAQVLAIFPDPYEIELRGGREFWQYGFAELIFSDGILRDWFNL
jgi:hypothetical protein